MDCSPPGSSVHGDSPGKNTGVSCHALLQGLVPNQGWNPGLLHCRQILYSLSHQGSPKDKINAKKKKKNSPQQPKLFLITIQLELIILLLKFLFCYLVAKSCLILLGPRGLYPTRLPCPWISQARMLEWVASSFSRGYCRNRDRAGVSALADGLFTTEPSGKPSEFL